MQRSSDAEFSLPPPPPGSLGAANLNEVIERALALFPDYELPGSARPVSFATPEAAAAIASGPPAETEGEDEGTEAGAAASSTSSTPPPAAAATAEEAGAEAGRGPRRLWVVWQTGERDHARVAQRCSHPRLVRTGPSAPRLPFRLNQAQSAIS